MTLNQLTQERDELKSKIDAFESYLQSDKALWSDRDEYEDCCKQRSAMITYLIYLNSRIERQSNA